MSKRIYLNKVELKRMIKSTLLEVLTETGGASSEAIKLIDTELMPILEKLRPYKSLHDYSISVNLTGLGKINVVIYGYLKDLNLPSDTTSEYNAKLKTLFIRAHRLNHEDWRTLISGDILHELTHALEINGYNSKPQVGNKNLTNYEKAHEYLNKNITNQLAQDIQYIFKDSEINARVGEMFYDVKDLLETIPKEYQGRVLDPHFLLKLIEKTEQTHKLNEMRKILEKVANIAVNEDTFFGFHSMALAINNKTARKADKALGEYAKLSALFNRAEASKKAKYQRLMVNQAKYLKMIVYNEIETLYEDFKKRIERICQFLISEYVSHGYKFRENLWHPEQPKKVETNIYGRPVVR